MIGVAHFLSKTTPLFFFAATQNTAVNTTRRTPSFTSTATRGDIRRSCHAAASVRIQPGSGAFRDRCYTARPAAIVTIVAKVGGVDVKVLYNWVVILVKLYAPRYKVVQL